MSKPKTFKVTRSWFAAKIGDVLIQRNEVGLMSDALPGDLCYASHYTTVVPSFWINEAIDGGWIEEIKEL